MPRGIPNKPKRQYKRRVLNTKQMYRRVLAYRIRELETELRKARSLMAAFRRSDN